MNHQHNPARAHVADQLPLYINGALDSIERERVRAHLVGCVACAAELATWQAVAGAAQALVAGAPAHAQNPAALLGAVWTRIDALEGVGRAEAVESGAHGGAIPEVTGATLNHLTAPTTASPPPSSPELEVVLRAQAPHRRAPAIRRAAAQWAQMTLAQARLIHRGLWVASALCIVAVTLYAAATHYRGGLTTLAVALPMVAAAGAAFIYGREADPALEVALATCASPRAIVLSRIGLVFGYNVALGVVATVVVALTHGENVASAITLWLGPSALLASGALLLSLLGGPLVSVVAAAGAWLAQVIQLQGAQGASIIHLSGTPLWGANWQAIALTGAFLLLAVLYAPRQERLA